MESADDEDEDDVGEEGPRAIGCDTELQLYIDSPKSDSVLRFWETKKTVLARLYVISRKVFCVPATSAGVERLFSISGFIFGSRRLRLTDKNFEDQIFTHSNADLLDAVCRNRKSACF